MKKISFIFLVLILSLFLFSCDKEEGNDNETPIVEEENGKVIPIYEGVSFTSDSINMKNKKNKNDKNEEEDSFNDEVIEDSIKHNFGVLTTDELAYYTVKGEKAYITLNFHNPDQFEILSFVLNGVKYQTFQFTEDSTAEKITVGITIPNESGVFEYFIEQVKYIDGNKIKDCKMEGNQSIKIGIGYDIVPSSSSSFEVSYDEFEIDTTVLDSSNIIEKSKGKIKVFIYDEEGNLIDAKELKIGKNNVQFKKLNTNKKYRYVIAATYDSMNGEGMNAIILEQGDFKTKSYLTFDNSSVTKNSISFDLVNDVEGITIKEVSLFLENENIKTITDGQYLFSGLLSNTEYKVVVKYEYNEIEYTTSNVFKTQETSVPLVDFTFVSDKKSISYEIITTDLDSVLKIDKINLIKDGSVIESKETLNGEFEKLLSNTKYEIEVIYSYDLNTGAKEVTETIKKEVTTKALSVANYGINYSIDETHISGEVIVNDSDFTSTLTSVDLYKVNNEVLVATSSEATFDFVISGNTKYKIVVNYSYNLNDGNGILEGSYEFAFYSSKVVPSLKIERLSISSNSYEFDLDIIDLSLCGEVKAIYLYKGSELVKKVPTTNYLLEDLSSNTTYKLVVEYAYDLEDGNGVVTFTEEVSFTTLKATPSVVIENSVITESSIKVNPTISDTDNAGQLSKVELYLNAQLIQVLTEEYLFENLLSNTKYEVKCYYEYNNNLEDQVLVSTKEITTSKLEAPTVDVELECDKNRISFNTLIGTATLVKVELFKNEVNVLTSTDLNGIFKDLLSNTQYTVKVTYTYDLNDGNGSLTGSISKTITTSSLQAPVVGVKNDIVTDKDIVGQVIIDDVDKVFELNNISLYQNGSLIQTMNSGLNYAFKVEANVSYKIVVDYSYDLKDGNGKISEKYETTLTTMKELPTININAYYISQEYVYFDFTVNDINSVGHMKSVRLYENGQYLKDMSQYDSSLYDLDSNTSYMIKAIYVYDFNDGNGSREFEYVYEFKTLKDSPEYYLYATSDKNSITINHNKTDNDGALTYQYTKLYIGDELVEEYDDYSKVEFDNLLSNTLYTIEVAFTCDINNGEFEYVRSYSIYTIPLDNPYLYLSSDTTETSISYNYEIIDNDYTIVSSEIYLLLNGEKQDILPVDNKFTNLLSNNNYKIVVSLMCDFNDGNGEVEVLYEFYATTIALQAPSVSMEFVSTEETITFTEEIIDRYDIFVFDLIEIYDGETLIDTIKDLSIKTIENLKSNTVYTFKIKYHYDLNDGKGDINGEITKDFSTLAKPVIITGFDILNEYTPKTNEDISIKFYVENESNVEIKTLTINGTEYIISGGNIKEDIVVVVDSGDVSGELNFVLSKMSYYLNGFNVTQDIDFKEEIKITVLSRLNILNVSTMDGTNTYKLNNGYKKFIIKLDNPECYEILSVKYGWNKEVATDVIMIDNNHITFTLREEYISERSIYIYEITYIDADGRTATRKYEKQFLLDAVGLDPDSTTYTLLVNSISTPEQLLAMESGKAYELSCDIDMSGYNWSIRDFNGFFDGKGHTIKNLTITIEDEYTNQKEVGIFNTLSGIFRNVYFENIYISVQTLGYVDFDLLHSYGNPEITNVLISGAAVLKTTYNISIDPVVGDSIYIVDDFTINSIKMNYNNVLKSSDLTDEFKEETLGWKFLEKEFNKYGDFDYYLIDDSYIFISKYNGSASKVVIPEEIDGKPIIGISDFAFENCVSLEEIYFNNNIINYGGSIFKGCYNLKAIYNMSGEIQRLDYLFGYEQYLNSYKTEYGYIPNTLKTISFADEAKVINEYVCYNFKSLTEIILPTGLVEIKDNAFYNCDGVEEIELPNTLQKIGGYAFYSCNSLNQIFIPDGVLEVGWEAFSNCSLNVVRIPKSINAIQYGAFGWSNLYFAGSESEWENIKLYDSNASNYVNGLNIRFNVSQIEYVKTNEYSYLLRDKKYVENFYMFDKSITEFSFEEEFPKYEIISIASDGFSDCVSLESISLPDSITNIGNNAFIRCESLESIILPANLKVLRASTFADCRNLTTVIMQEGLEEIQDNALGTNSIRVIYLPSSVKTIMYNSFGWDSNICQGLYYAGSEEQFTQINISSDNNFIKNVYKEYEVSEVEFISCDKYEYTIVNNEYITNFHSKDVKITEFDFTKEIPGYNIKALGIDAFKNHNDLTSVVLPEVVIQISESAFRDCYKLASINLPESLEIIKYDAFGYCYALRSIVIPDTVKVIEEGAFYASGIRNIHLGSGMTELNNIFNHGSNIYSIYIPKNIIKINNEALSELNMNSLISYGGNEEEWSKLNVNTNSYVIYEVVSVEEIITENEEFILINDKDVYNYVNLDKSITTFNFEESYPNYNLISLGSYAFNDFDKLENIVLPETLKYIGTHAFDNNDKIESIKIPDSVEKIGSNAFINCYGLKEVYLGNGLKVLDNIFHGNGRDLRFIYIPNSVTEIKQDILSNMSDTSYIFYEGTEEDWNKFSVKTNATVIYEVTTLEKVETEVDKYFLINNQDVYDYVNLDKSITAFNFEENYPKYNLISLGYHAFYDFDKLENIVLPETLKYIGTHAFDNSDKIESIKIPDSVEKIGSNAFIYCYGLKEVYLGNGLKVLDNIFYSNGSDLRFIYIPNSVTEIKQDILSNMSDASHIFYEGTEENWNKLSVKTNAIIIYEVSSFEIVKTNVDKYALVNDTDVYDYVNLDKTITTFDFEESYPEYNLISLGSDAFYQHDQLLTLKLPDTLTYINYHAIGYINQIDSLIIPNSVLKIKQSAFEIFYSLRNVILGNGLTLLDNVFSNEGEYIDAIYIPKSVTKITKEALLNMSKSSYIFYEGTEEEWNKFNVDTNATIIYEVSSIEIVKTKVDKYVLVNDTDVYNYVSLDKTITTFDFEESYPEYNLISLGSLAFNDFDKLENIVLPETLKYIGTQAFDNSDKIESIKIPDSVEKIGSNAFIYCYGLKEVYLGNGLKSLNDIFDNKGYSLNTLYISKNIASIHYEALENMRESSVIFYEGTEDDWNKFNVDTKAKIVYEVTNFEKVETKTESYLLINDKDVYSYVNLDKEIVVFNFSESHPNYNLITLGNHAFYDHSDLVKITLPDTLIHIGERAFGNCSSLLEINIPDSVKFIDACAFSNCQSLTKIIIPDSVKHLGYNVFESCYNLKYIYLSKNLTALEENIFYNNGSNLSVIFIPKNITNINLNIFNNISNEAYILYEGTMEEWDKLNLSVKSNIHYNVNNIEFVKTKTAEFILVNNKDVYDYVHLDKTITEFNFEESYPNYNLISLGTGAFYEFRSLSSVTLPNTLEIIGNYAFYGCYSLNEITIPNSVKVIGYYAFNCCSGLNSVVIPDSVEIIKNDAFTNCQNLNYITLGKGMTKLNYIFDNGGHYSIAIYIPKNITAINQDALCNMTKTSYIYYEGTQEEWEQLYINVNAIIVYEATSMPEFE